MKNYVIPGLILQYCFYHAIANTEKAIFLAPTLQISVTDESLNNLLLSSLTNEHRILRTLVNASFPSAENPKGDDTWVLMKGLHPGQRYEVRICWIATQPTAFQLDTFELDHVFETSELISSLSNYAYKRHNTLSLQDNNDAGNTQSLSDPLKGASMLFLRIQAAADYFSLNGSLMESVNPVFVDLILDPYMFNVLPQSLLPIGGYVIILAIFAWYLSGYVYQICLNVATIDRSKRSLAKKAT